MQKPEKITGAQLKKRMRASSISVGEMAKAAEVDVTTVEDYMRDSRWPSRAVTDALAELESRTPERMDCARRHLLAAYQKEYRACQNPPGVQLPAMTAVEVKGFINISNSAPPAGIPEDGQKGQSFEEWVAALAQRIETFYAQPDAERGGIVLQGSPGGGKTTVIRLLVTEEKHFEHFTPAILPLPQVASTASEKDIMDAVYSYISGKHWVDYLPDLRGFLEYEYGRKRLIYIFDGFDEISHGERVSLLARLRFWPTPYLLAGRPTFPRISECLPLAPVCFVAKLTLKNILAFIDFRAKQCEDIGDIEAAENIRRFGGAVRPLKKSIASGRDLDATFTGSIAGGAAHFREQYRADEEINGLLATPATLNLVLNFIRDGKVQGVPSAEHLLDLYVDFLSNKWWRLRSLASLDAPRQKDYADCTGYIKILGATAWLAMFVAYHQPDLPISVIKGRVVEMLKEWDGIEKPEDRFDEAMFIGIDAQLLDMDAYENNKIKFGVSHELLLSYFAGRFIHLATFLLLDAKNPSRFAGTLPGMTIDGCNWLELAEFDEMLSRPTLGVARDAIFFYLTHLYNQDNVPRSIPDRKVFILSTLTRISEEDAGVPPELIHHILPGNKIVAWRTLVSKEIQHTKVEGSRMQREMETLTEWLRNAFRHTNFEYVFEAIFRSCGDRLLVDGDHVDPMNDDEEGWRFCKTFPELRRWIDKTGCFEGVKKYLLADGHLQVHDIWKLRRSIYIMRYYTGDIGDEMINFLREICAWEEDVVKNGAVFSGPAPQSKYKDAQGLAGMARGTARFLTQGFPEQEGEGSAYLDEWMAAISPENYSWLDQIKRQAILEEAQVRRWESALAAEMTPEAYFGLYLKGPEIKFGGGEVFAHNVIDRGVSADWHVELARLCVDKLTAFQQTEDNGLEEVKILNLVMCLASSHYHRMFFLPKRYSLSELGLQEPPQSFCDENCLMIKTLFKGAVKGLPTEATAEEENTSTRTGGEFQVYDYYVRAIWRLLHEDPITLVGV